MGLKFKLQRFDHPLLLIHPIPNTKQKLFKISKGSTGGEQAFALDLFLVLMVLDEPSETFSHGHKLPEDLGIRGQRWLHQDGPVWGPQGRVGQKLLLLNKM